MAPKQLVSTTTKKGKKKATRSTSKRSRVESTDSSHYLSKEHKERFNKVTCYWSIWEERRLQLEDFLHSKVFNLIDVCGWSGLAETLHKIYSQLIHEFYANFNQEIDIQGIEHYGQMWI
ncbi:Uncharacterized protein Adt_06575 [Abeliophyllum distichum]|uniref:Uncharacterized protein n=1 Tax=Abeliophyllum distichum TaxID=126358 RepID=A0ABD1V7E8_9LAMI